MPKAYDQHMNNLPWSLAMVQDGHDVNIVAVDDNGDELETIAFFSRDGALHLMEAVTDETAHNLGLQRNRKGQLKVAK